MIDITRWKEHKVVVSLGTLAALGAALISVGAWRGWAPLAAIGISGYAVEAEADPAIRQRLESTERQVSLQRQKLTQLEHAFDKAEIDRGEIKKDLGEVKADTKVIRAILEERTGKH